MNGINLLEDLLYFRYSSANPSISILSSILILPRKTGTRGFRRLRTHRSNRRR